MLESVAPAWPVTVPALTPHSTLRQSVKALENSVMDGARLIFRSAELTGPVFAWLSKDRIKIIRNVPYLGSGEEKHLLDVYRPIDSDHNERRPVVMYVHGGAFELCSKETHWVMAQSYAQRGYVVFTINYRLAPKHPFPTPLMDVCSAYQWVLDNAARFGGDPTRIILAGESAGANLASSLALLTCVARPEPWANAVFRRGVVPAAVVAACGLFEVSNPQRFHDIARESWRISRVVIEQIRRRYLPTDPRWEGEHDLANPLHILERAEPFTRALPPFFVPCGTNNPILDDTRRLERALEKLGVPYEARYYEGEIHAFHAMWWRAQSRRCWEDTMSFLARQLAAHDVGRGSVAA